MANTIAAIATAHGVGSIAIVRLSGDEALSFASKITHDNSLTPRYAHLKTLYNSDQTVIDEAIVLYFKGPNSFTGEDVVEFQCHGGVIVASMLLDALIEEGATLATPGEFSKRAFLNGRIDLTQAEAIANLIDAKSEDAAKILAKQMKGDLREFIESVRDELLLLIAYSEVTIDYAEEDLPEDLIQQMREKLQNIANTLQKSVHASKQRMVLIDGFKVAIIGRPNVGKSSLLNALLHYDRAIVSDIAGTTRDTIEESIKIGTHLIRIIDTAGIRNANDTIERIGIEKSMETVEEADIIIALFDGSQQLQSDDEVILNIIKEHEDKKSIVVLNKSDLGQVVDEESFSGFNLLKLSCKEDTQLLIDALSQLMDEDNHTHDNTLISKRQILAVEAAISEIHAAIDPLEMNELEIFSFHLNQAIAEVASITRPMEYDEILDKMFGSFCLGK
jgi:tRNA modification GTPase